MGNKVNKQIGTYDKLQVKHSVHIVSSNIKQQSSFQFNLGNQVHTIVNQSIINVPTGGNQMITMQ
jgi:hypothetical protein